MKNIRSLAARAFGAALLTSVAMPLQAQTIASLPDGRNTPFFTLGDRARPPLGYHDMCIREPAECDQTPSPLVTVKLTPANWKELKNAHLHWNKTLVPMPDLDNYGPDPQGRFGVNKEDGRKQNDVWARVTRGYADCEDYVLTKLHYLVKKLGWPRGAFFIAMVKDPGEKNPNEFHVVLVVKTDKGNLVLDNQRDDIRLWSDTGYEFKKVFDPSRLAWYDVVAPQPAAQVASTGHLPAPQNNVTGQFISRKIVGTPGQPLDLKQFRRVNDQGLRRSIQP